jgi:hypothetical protein
VTGRHKAKLEVRKRLKDLALYILICVLVLATIAGLASTGIKWDTLFKLLQSLMFPIVLFGIAVPKRRSRWKNKRFWLTIGATLLTHAVLFAILASRTETLKPAVTSIMAVPEFLLWMIADHWQMELADRKSKRTNKRVGSIS